MVEEAVEENVSWKIIRSGESMLCLYEYSGARTFLGPAQFNERQLHGMYHFGLRITNREKWEQTLEREKIPVGYGGAFPWPHSDSWYIFDPTGYQIEVVLWDGNQIHF